MRLITGSSLAYHWVISGLSWVKEAYEQPSGRGQVSPWKHGKIPGLFQPVMEKPVEKRFSNG
jgi:hypothetical protein